MNEVNIVENKEYSFDEFELFMFALFEQTEESKNSNEKNVPNNNEQKKKNILGVFKSKTCNGVCLIF